jgi:hypothetical protein
LSVGVENNVCMPSKNQWTRFVNLTAGSRVAIYNPNGVKIKEWRDVAGTLEWHADDEDGRGVGSDVYVASIESGRRNVTYKLVVVR